MIRCISCSRGLETEHSDREVQDALLGRPWRCHHCLPDGEGEAVVCRYRREAMAHRQEAEIGASLAEIFEELAERTEAL